MLQQQKEKGAGTAPQTEASSRIAGIGCLLAFAVMSAWVFREAWIPYNSIEGADLSIAFPRFVREWTEWGFVPRWFPHYLAGIPQQFQFLSHGLALTLLLPPHRFHGLEFMLDTFLAGAFMFAFLRDRRIGRFGSLVGGLSFQLGNGLLTSAGQGFLWKFDTVCWVPLFLLFFTRVVDSRKNRLRNAALAGVTLGLQFLGGEVQLAYYVGLLALAYFVVYSLFIPVIRNGNSLRATLRLAGNRFLLASLSAVICGVFAAEALFSYMSYVGSNENVGVQSAQDNWRFATEFSFPPKETLSLAFTGNVFGNDFLPRYHEGRLVPRRSDDYLGIVPLMFAVVALFSGRREAIFFACVSVMALALSYGKYFPPPYRLVYMLPAMKGLRNPHKWLFITSLCVPILAGMGADSWWNAPASKNKRIFSALLLFAVVMGITAAVTLLVRPNGAEGTGRLAALGRQGILLGVAGIVCAGARIPKIRQTKLALLACPALLVVLLAADLAENADRHIRFYDYRERYVNDDLAQWLESKPGPFRVKLWSENAYLRRFVTKALPYKGIDAVDAIMSRRPERYTDVFEAVREQRLPLERFFQLFNVKYVLSATPIFRKDLSLSRATDFDPGAEMGVNGGRHVYEFSDFLPRAYVVGNFEVVEPERMIDYMANPKFDFRKTVLLEKQPALVHSAPFTEPADWKVEDFTHSPHRVSMRATVNRPSMLVLHDFFDDRWRARIDGHDLELLQANYLMRAVAVPEGRHDVTFTYAPPRLGYVLTLGGWLALAVSLPVWTLLRVARTGRSVST